MPMAITPVPLFPSVPANPGVPPVLRQVGAINSNIVLLVADVGRIINLFSGPQWGLFAKGAAPVLIPDSVLKVSYRNETMVSSAPQEKGGFMSYNKVQQPFNARVTFAKGGTAASRLAFLTACEAALHSLELYDLVMPEGSRKNVNVTHYDFERTAMSGVTLLTVDVWVEEIRIVGSPQFSNTAAPGGADPQSAGALSATPVGAAVPTGALT